MSRFDRKQQNSIKQLSFNKKKKKRKSKRKKIKETENRVVDARSWNMGKARRWDQKVQ